MDWSGVDYLWIIVMFLSAVWTLILTAPIHCRGSIAEQVMECYISPNLMKKQTHLHLGWPQGEHIFTSVSIKASWKACVCTLAARRLTASSRRRCSSGVLGQLLDRRVLVALSGGVGWGGWLRGGSELGSPPAHVTDEYPHEHKYLQLLRFYRDESNINTQTSQTV